MKPNYFLTTFLIMQFATIANSQNALHKVDIYLSPGGNFTGMYFPLNSSCTDTVKETISENSYYMCYLKDCMGAMKFEAFTNGILVIEGNYVNSIDTFKRCVVVDDGHNPNQPMIVKAEEYLQPLKDGTWKYYDKKGKLIKEETWDKGILIEGKKMG